MIAKSQIFQIVNSVLYASLILSANQGIHAMDADIMDESLARDLQPIHEAINHNSSLKKEVDALNAYQEQKLLSSLASEEKQIFAEQYFEDAGMINDKLKRQAYIVKSFLLRHDATKKADKNEKKEYISCLGMFLSSVSKKQNINQSLGGEALLESVSQKLHELGEVKSPETPSLDSSDDALAPSPSPTLRRHKSADSLPVRKKRKIDKAE